MEHKHIWLTRTMWQTKINYEDKFKIKKISTDENEKKIMEENGGGHGKERKKKEKKGLLHCSYEYLKRWGGRPVFLVDEWNWGIKMKMKYRKRGENEKERKKKSKEIKFYLYCIRNEPCV